MKIWLTALNAFCLIGFLGAQASTTTPQQQFIEKVAPSIVSVEVVVRVEISAEGESDTQEQKQFITGTVLTADGVILVPATSFSDEWFKQFLGDQEEFQVKITPQSFKVSFAGDTKQYDAELLATDSQLGIGFIKIKELGERTITHVRFTDTLPRIGEELWTVRRKGKAFDNAPYLERVPVAGAITKPRKALILESVATVLYEPGTLLYTPEGEAIGVLIMIFDKDAREEGFGGFFRFFGGRTPSVMESYLLPYAEFKPTLEKALERKQGGTTQ